MKSRPSRGQRRARRRRQDLGPKTLRALALVAELVYGTPTSTRDPARFAFAHGGKDGTPYPVDRETYDRTIEDGHPRVAVRTELLDVVDRLLEPNTYCFNEAVEEVARMRA